MKKLTLALFAIFAFTFFACEVEPSGENLEATAGKGKIKNNSVEFDFSEECLTSEAILYAGQNIEVGKVTVSEIGGNYLITYEITNDEWCITETHLSVVNSPEEFPITNAGNPKNGNFEYSDEFACEKTVTYEVPIEKGPYIAAHAVVECVSSSVETIVANLPETLEFCTVNQGPDAYLNITIGEGSLAGSYGAWCIDNDSPIQLSNCYTADVYALNEELPDSAFEYPENFDLVNWLLNQNIVGEPSVSSGEAYTYGDLQFAIWKLLDDIEDESCAECNLGTFTSGHVDELVALAQENGTDFNPECGNVTGVILISEGVQPLIIPTPLDCNTCEETAWADGCDFPGNNWATYFQYD
ncbi:hypothetical protein D2V08_15850 [Flagellimonas lutimaris]|uniref:Uncharacterized protein n=1 Tax=Flagellimonas lutimaris TaxID=475082 RepID=A0A3A1N5P5_9FLAO|nr:hypothetical protein [Allomuricauda lutimaris]RIV30559.1 hypothetical protein D2V08_15850 [Allomuricauda lutimaris]